MDGREVVIGSTSMCEWNVHLHRLCRIMVKDVRESWAETCLLDGPDKHGCNSSQDAIEKVEAERMVSGLREEGHDCGRGRVSDRRGQVRARRAKRPMSTMHFVRRSPWIGLCVLAVVGWLQATPVSAEHASGKRTPEQAKGEGGSCSAEKKAEAKRWFERAQTLYEKKQLREARNAMESSYTACPGPLLAYNVGRLCERVSDVACALEYLDRYLKEGSPSKKERADLLKRMTAMRKLAERRKAQELVLPPSREDLAGAGRESFERGVKMFERKEYAAAMQAFTAALSLTQLPDLYFNLGVTAERMGNRLDAIDYFREYLNQKKDCPDREEVLARIQGLRAR